MGTCPAAAGEASATSPRVSRQAELAAEGDVEAGEIERRTGEDGVRDRVLGVGAEMEVERVAHLGGDPADAVGERDARELGVLGGRWPRRALRERRRRARARRRASARAPARGTERALSLDGGDARRASANGSAGARGDLGDDLVDAAGDHARELAGRPGGDGQVGQAADREVEDALGVGDVDGRSARIIPKAARSTPSGRSPAWRAASSTRSTMSRRAATSSTRMRASAVDLDDAERVVVEHDALDRHRDLVLRLEADGAVELLGVEDRRQLDLAHDDALVGDADPHAAVEAAAVEELRERARSARRGR